MLQFLKFRNAVLDAGADEIIHGSAGVEQHVGGGRVSNAKLLGECDGPEVPRHSEARDHEAKHHEGQGEGGTVLLLVDGCHACGARVSNRMGTRRSALGVDTAQIHLGRMRAVKAARTNLWVPFLEL